MNNKCSDQGFGSGSGRIRCFLPGSGSGFLISLDPDSVSAPGSRSKKGCRKGSKRYLLEENLKIMIKDRQKMKKATISY